MNAIFDLLGVLRHEGRTVARLELVNSEYNHTLVGELIKEFHEATDENSVLILSQEREELANMMNYISIDSAWRNPFLIKSRDKSVAAIHCISENVASLAGRKCANILIVVIGPLDDYYYQVIESLLASQNANLVVLND